ncbi:MAG: type II toxin-antitoxin system VapC family toxin [Nitrospirae bacterium]|nr:type II toxin-antitoxin system VapC family toxin [Nitrospirota bacterium]
MRYLVDTSAISELIRPRPEPKVVRWIDERDEASLFLSVLTLGELHKGIARLADGKRKARLRDWVDDDLGRRFYARILPVDAETAVAWGRMQGEAAARGEPLPAVDSLIAATAVVHHLTVVTRNVRDIARCGAEVLNPWE